MKIREKLIIIFILIACIPMSSIAIFSYFNTRQMIVDRWIVELGIIADVKIEKIRQFFKDSENEMKIAQDYFNVKNNFPIINQFFSNRAGAEYSEAEERLDSQLQTFVNVKKLGSIMLVNPQGMVVYTTDKKNADQILGKPLQDKKAFDEGQIEVYFSEILEDTDNGTDKDTEKDYYLLVTAPAYSFDGGFVGVIAFKVTMNPVYQLINERTGLGETGEAFFCRKEGDHVLFLHNLKYDSRAAFQRKLYYTENIGLPIQEATQGKSGAGLAIDYRPQFVIAAWRTLNAGNRPWGLVAQIDQKEAFLPIVRAGNFIILVSIIVFAIVLGLAYWIANLFSNPINRLTQQAKEISKGRLNVRVQINSQDELGDLARTFNQMTGDLQTTTVSRDELAQEVEQRKLVEKVMEQTTKDLKESETRLDLAIKGSEAGIWDWIDVDRNDFIIFVA